MATDTLQIFGTSYTGVTGFKATDSNNTTKTYIRPQGTKSITANGTGIDVTEYASVDVSVASVVATYPTFTVTMDSNWSTIQSVTCDKTYSECYNYYDNGILEAVLAITNGTNGAHYGATGNYASNKMTYYADLQGIGVAIMKIEYASSGTITGTMMPIPFNDSTDMTVSGATVTAPAGYYQSAASATVASGSVTAPATISGTSATVSTGTNTLTLTKIVSVTPTVSTAGYVSSGTAGDSSVSLTASVTVNPTPTASGATVTIPAGYYSAQTTKSVDTMTLPTSASSSATSGYSSKATIGRSTSDQYINIPPGYNSAGGYYKVSAVANGSATGPSSLSGSSATVSTGTNTITLTKTGVTTTPTVSAGYVSSATASTATVALTASVTTKAAATITPGTTDQTIASGTYLTGTQTISGDSNLVASNIISGKTIFGVSGSVVIQHYYTGSGTPSNSTGANGDIYLKTS